MGGLQCAKVIIDQANGAMAELKKQEAALGKSLGCMTATLTLYSQYAEPTEAQEDEFTLLCSQAISAVRQQLNSIASMAADIEAYVREKSEQPQIDIGREPPGKGDKGG